MPRDIRNIERGACIEGCRSCPNFLSVEPGRVLCDYCGCPPTKHEVVQPHSLLPIEDQTKCEFTLNTSKEIGRITELKNDGMCFPASRTSSNDSGCYIYSSFGSSSTSTSASSSSCSPYISEEEVEGVEDDCFEPHKGNNCENELSANHITPKLKQSLVELKSKDTCCAGVYNCSSTEIVVKIRNKEQENHAVHNSLINATELNTSHFQCRTTQIEDSGKQISEEQLTYPTSICKNSAYITCKRKAYNSTIAEKEGCKEDESLLVIPTTIASGEEIVSVEEKCTLQGMGQLEIGDDRPGLHDLPKTVENIGENKIIRAEGDCDVSDHNRKTNIGVIQCERRSECNTLI